MKKLMLRMLCIFMLVSCLDVHAQKGGCYPPMPPPVLTVQPLTTGEKMLYYQNQPFVGNRIDILAKEKTILAQPESAQLVILSDDNACCGITNRFLFMNIGSYWYLVTEQKAHSGNSFMTMEYAQFSTDYSTILVHYRIDYAGIHTTSTQSFLWKTIKIN